MNILSNKILADATPRGNRVLVRRNRPRKKSSGGILLPDSSAVDEMWGVVVRVGNGKLCEDGQRHPPDDLKPGMRVVFTRYAGAPVADAEPGQEDGEYEYLLVAEDEIVAVLPG